MFQGCSHGLKPKVLAVIHTTKCFCSYVEQLLSSLNEVWPVLTHELLSHLPGPSQAMQEACRQLILKVIECPDQRPSPASFTSTGVALVQCKECLTRVIMTVAATCLGSDRSLFSCMMLWILLGIYFLFFTSCILLVTVVWNIKYFMPFLPFFSLLW